MKLFFYRKFIRFVIKHFTIVINNTIQMNGGQYIEHMNNYQERRMRNVWTKNDHHERW